MFLPLNLTSLILHPNFEVSRNECVMKCRAPLQLEAARVSETGAEASLDLLGVNQLVEL